MIKRIVQNYAIFRKVAELHIYGQWRRINANVFFFFTGTFESVIKLSTVRDTILLLLQLIWFDDFFIKPERSKIVNY